HLLPRRAHVQRGVDVRAQLVAALEHGQRRHRTQLALLLRDHLAAVEPAREEHRQLSRQVLVELFPQLEARAALERVKQLARGIARLLLELRLVHGCLPREPRDIIARRDTLGVNPQCSTRTSFAPMTFAGASAPTSIPRSSAWSRVLTAH